VRRNQYNRQVISASLDFGCYKNLRQENQFLILKMCQTNLQGATGTSSQQRLYRMKRKCERKQQKKDLSSGYVSFF